MGLGYQIAPERSPRTSERDGSIGVWTAVLHWGRIRGMGDPNDTRMSPEQIQEMAAAMLESLEGHQMEGLSLDDLKDAMTAPGAVESMAELMPREAGAPNVGDPAPDFTLPYLPGSTNQGTVTLSDHFGKRPVALIFGSYT